MFMCICKFNHLFKFLRPRWQTCNEVCTITHFRRQAFIIVKPDKGIWFSSISFLRRCLLHLCIRKFFYFQTVLWNPCGCPRCGPFAFQELKNYNSCIHSLQKRTLSKIDPRYSKTNYVLGKKILYHYWEYPTCNYGALCIWPHTAELDQGMLRTKPKQTKPNLEHLH